MNHIESQTGSPTLPENSPISEKNQLSDAYQRGVALSCQFFDRLGVSALLAEEKTRFENQGYVVEEQPFEDFDQWYESIRSSKYGSGTGSSTIRDNVSFGIALKIKKDSSDNVYRRLSVVTRFNATMSSGNYTGIKEKPCLISVLMFDNFREPTGTQTFVSSEQSQGIILPEIGDIDELCLTDFNKIFRTSINKPITMRERALTGSTIGRRPTSFNNIPAINHHERIGEEKQKKQEFVELILEFEKLNVSNPFANKEIKLGEISYQLGKIILNRYGIEEVLARLREEGKTTVFSSSQVGDIYAFSVRWDLGEFRDYQGKEITVAVKPTEDDLVALRKGSFDGIKTAKVFVIAGAQDILDLQLPICPSFGSLTPEQQYTFLKKHKGGKTALLAAIEKALRDPRKALTITEGSIASSLAYAKPIISDVKKKTIETKPQAQAEYNSRSYDDDDDDDDDDDYNQRTGTQARLQQEEEEEEWLLEDDSDNRISIGEAHGEVTWLEGTGTDEDGCDVYSSD